MDIVEPTDWPRVRDSLPAAEFLLEALIPTHAKTLVHGPPGCGKSAFLWGAANAISDGLMYLGLKTMKAKVFLLSTDMTQHNFKLRWHTYFLPKFPFLCLPKFDVTKKSFRNHSVYQQVKLYLESNNIEAVFIDALGGVHAGRSAKDDETATLVDAALTDWFESRAIISLAHDRKVRLGNDGEAINPGPEDFLGSQLWRSNTTSQIHMWPTGQHRSLIKHDKSQVGPELEDPIKLYIDIHGQAELWNEVRAKEVANKWNEAVKKLDLASLSATEQVKKVAAYYKAGERTVWRWRSFSKSGI